MLDLSEPCGMTCVCIHVCQGDMQRQSVLFPLCIIECSKFLSSSDVMMEPCSVVSSTSLFELEQHPEGAGLKPAPAGTLIAIPASPEGSGSEGYSRKLNSGALHLTHVIEMEHVFIGFMSSLCWNLILSLAYHCTVLLAMYCFKHHCPSKYSYLILKECFTSQMTTCLSISDPMLQVMNLKSPIKIPKPQNYTNSAMQR